MSKIDFTGQQIGYWTVLEKAENIRKRVSWLCACRCKNEKIITSVGLKTGSPISCGCHRKEKQIKKMVGRTFGRLKVVDASSIPPKRNEGLKFICFCSCGGVVEVSMWSLIYGKTKSCGCLQKEGLINRFLKHGMSKTNEYKIYDGMKQRCYNENSQACQYYSKKDTPVTVCDRWLHGENGKHGFLCFLEDVGKRPSKNHSLDRINNEGNYEPTNVKWSTDKEQSRNKSSNRLITYKNETKCLTDWCDKFDKEFDTVSHRLKIGWSLDKAFETDTKEKNKLIEYDGRALCIVEWSNETGIESNTLYDRLSAGWSIEKSLTTPVRKHNKRQQKS